MPNLPHYQHPSPEWYTCYNAACTLTHYNCPKSRVYLRFHCWFCTFVGLDKYMIRICHHRVPENPLCSNCSSLLNAPAWGQPLNLLLSHNFLTIKYILAVYIVCQGEEVFLYSKYTQTFFFFARKVVLFLSSHPLNRVDYLLSHTSASTDMIMLIFFFSLMMWWMTLIFKYWISLAHLR